MNGQPDRGARPQPEPNDRAGPHGSRGLRPADVARLAITGLAGRPVRAVLSALGVALGVATTVAVLGLSASSRAQLVAEIDSLGTNMLTAQPSPLAGAQNATLPAAAPAMAARIGPVISVGAVGAVGASIYKNDHIPAADTEAISVEAASPSLLGTVEGHLYRGRFLNAATSRFPAVVLGSDAASALGLDQAGTQAWLGSQWFTVVGIMRPVLLAPELDRAALIGFAQAAGLAGQPVLPTELYVRTDPRSSTAVGSVLAATVDPASPQDVQVTNPTDALVARADASFALQGLFLALGAVALAVGGIGIANVMVIGVLERRGEIGLRRALGARRAHIGIQFLAESSLLALTGGAGGAILGGFAVTVFAAARRWDALVPVPALLLAVGSALAVGATAGIYPALKAARLAPAEGLRTV
jgi:ABC-type lipoprotein release transport system permease subunit